MGPEWVAILALIALFVIGTLLPINMGALAYVAAWLVGMYSLNLDEKEILAGISADLVLTLIGVTYLFAIARQNGTVDLIVRSSVKAVGGRVALIPWVMFGVTAVITAIGAASPAACAIIGPIALGFAGRYKISPLMMGMFVVHGAQAGGFSPISIYGTITNSVMEENGLPSSEMTIFLSSLIVNLVMAGILFFVLGGRQLMSLRLDPDETAAATAAAARRRHHRGGTGAGGTATAVHRDPARGLRHRRHADDRHRRGRARDAHPPRPDPDPARVRRRRHRRPGLRQEHRLRLDHRRGAALDDLAEASTRTPSSRSPGRPCCWSPGVTHLRDDPDHRRLAGVRRQLGRRPGCGRHRRADPLLRRRRGLGVRVVDRAAAGDHPDLDPADRGRRHLGRPLRGGARGQLDDRRRQPVLHQRRADAGQPARHDHRAEVLQADPDLRGDRRPWSDRSSSGPLSWRRAGDGRSDVARCLPPNRSGTGTPRGRPRRRPLPRPRRAARRDDAR